MFLIISPLKAYASISAVSYWLYQSGGFRIGSVVENLPAMQETQETRVQFLGWEGPLQTEMATHSSVLAWEIP